MDSPAMQLEDEVGDVLEKAMRRSGLDDEALAERSGVPASRILDAIDYRSELEIDELRRLAAALDLNEVGLCALGKGRYPLPAIEEMPFCVWPLRMPHGIGVVNAYLVAGEGCQRGLLFDTGADIAALESVLPPHLRAIDAVFLTHVETEHAGGLCAVVAHFGEPPAFIPRGAVAPCGSPIGEGEVRVFGQLEVTVFSTPGLAPDHNCYLVRAPAAPAARGLLISGDLIFAGSAGGGYFCHRQLQTHLRRMLSTVPPATIIAPGHGPLTTVAEEKAHNPFF